MRLTESMNEAIYFSHEITVLFYGAYDVHVESTPAGECVFLISGDCIMFLWTLLSSQSSFSRYNPLYIVGPCFLIISTQQFKLL